MLANLARFPNLKSIKITGRVGHKESFDENWHWIGIPNSCCEQINEPLSLQEQSKMIHRFMDDLAAIWRGGRSRAPKYEVSFTADEAAIFKTRHLKPRQQTYFWSLEI